MAKGFSEEMPSVEDGYAGDSAWLLPDIVVNL
jgi:hypothetical protein